MSYSKQLQNIANTYLEKHGDVGATTTEMAQWAIANGYWEAQPNALVRQCADELSRAMREEYITDPQGRSVRAKHVARKEQAGEQHAFWADMRFASRSHMEMAFQQRRQGIVGDCKQLKTDVDSYNDNFNPSEAIQMIFDFTYDIEEAELAKLVNALM
jgi:hypothetical protein